MSDDSASSTLPSQAKPVAEQSQQPGTTARLPLHQSLPVMDGRNDGDHDETHLSNGRLSKDQHGSERIIVTTAATSDSGCGRDVDCSTDHDTRSQSTRSSRSTHSVSSQILSPSIADDTRPTAAVHVKVAPAAGSAHSDSANDAHVPVHTVTSRQTTHHSHTPHRAQNVPHRFEAPRTRSTTKQQIRTTTLQSLPSLPSSSSSALPSAPTTSSSSPLSSMQQSPLHHPQQSHSHSHQHPFHASSSLHPTRSPHRTPLHPLEDDRDQARYSGTASASESSQSVTTAATTTTTTRDPLHSPSLASSVGAGAASSEEESVAELGDVSEGECSSSVDGDHHRLALRRARALEIANELSKEFSSGVVAVAKRLSAPKSASRKPQPHVESPASAVTTDSVPPVVLQSSLKRKAHSMPPVSLGTPSSSSSQRHTRMSPKSPLPLSAVKVARFSEPADDSESLHDRPMSLLTRRTHSKTTKKARSAMKHYRTRSKDSDAHTHQLQHKKQPPTSAVCSAPSDRASLSSSLSSSATKPGATATSNTAALENNPSTPTPSTIPGSAASHPGAEISAGANPLLTRAASLISPRELPLNSARHGSHGPQPHDEDALQDKSKDSSTRHTDSPSPYHLKDPRRAQHQQQKQQQRRLELQQQSHDNDELDHLPTSLPKFREPRISMWTSSHAANSPSEDRSSSLVNVLLQPLPPNFDSETQLPPLEPEYTSLVRLSLWSVIDGHGGGCVATYASEVLLPHIAASISRSLGCAIVDRGVCEVNGQLRDANALDLDGLIKTSGRNTTNTNSIHYRSPYEASDSDEEDADGDDLSQVRDDDAATVNDSTGTKSQASTPVPSVASSLIDQSPAAASASSSVGASMSSVKTSVKTATSTAARDAPVGTHSPSEVAAITRAITESFLAVDEGWINSIDPVATHQTSCQSNGRWNSGACALVVFTVQRLEWTSVFEADREHGLRGPEKCMGHDTSQNKDAARRRMLDYATRAKSASSMSTISSTSSLTTTEDRVHTSGLESEITETEGEDDDHSTADHKHRRRDPSRRTSRGANLPKETLIKAPGSCACHCYRAYDALLYTAHVGDCRAVMLGSAPPRTIKVHGSADSHTDATDDESSHHSSDETECLSSSDHDANSSDDEDVNIEHGKSASLTKKTPTTSPYMAYMRRPTRRQRRRPGDDFGMNAPFIALPPLESFQSVEFEIDSDVDRRRGGQMGNPNGGDRSDSSQSSSQDSADIIQLPPVTRPIDLTTDHSAYNPAEVTAVLRRCNNAPRAISAGVGGGIKRVAGSLAVTRALGDAYLKTPLLSFNPYKRHAPYITARPEVNCRPLVKNGDKVIILATDGVWERATGEDALRWVRNFYAERIAKLERRKSRRLNTNSQSDRNASDCSDEAKQLHHDDDSDDRAEMDLVNTATNGSNVANNGVGGGASNSNATAANASNRKRERPLSPSPPTKRLKRGRLQNSSLSSRSTVADVIVRRVLNKVRRVKNISSLQALMSLPQGRARRSKHDDITASVVDLSAFVS